MLPIAIPAALMIEIMFITLYNEVGKKSIKKIAQNKARRNFVNEELSKNRNKLCI